jgi:hypothetical protein
MLNQTHLVTNERILLVKSTSIDIQCALQCCEGYLVAFFLLASSYVCFLWKPVLAAVEALSPGLLFSFASTSCLSVSVELLYFANSSRAEVSSSRNCAISVCGLSS